MVVAKAALLALVVAVFVGVLFGSVLCVPRTRQALLPVAGTVRAVEAVVGVGVLKSLHCCFVSGWKPAGEALDIVRTR